MGWGRVAAHPFVLSFVRFPPPPLPVSISSVNPRSHARPLASASAHPRAAASASACPRAAATASASARPRAAASASARPRVVGPFPPPRPLGAHQEKRGSAPALVSEVGRAQEGAAKQGGVGRGLCRSAVVVIDLQIRRVLPMPPLI
ncbi:hypothetical protein VPH35_030504 [Triticum aestivum]